MHNAAQMCVADLLAAALMKGEKHYTWRFQTSIHALDIGVEEV
jgi:hypothetical protein